MGEKEKAKKHLEIAMKRFEELPAEKDGELKEQMLAQMKMTLEGL